MALFPAFAGAPEPGEAPAGSSEGSRKELDWLSNPSFSTEDALLLHQRTTEAANLTPEKSPLISRSTSRSDLSGESDTDESLKKSSKKRKKKKKKHHHYKTKKKAKGDSSSSESDLDTKCIKDKAAANLDDKTSNLTSNRSVWLDDVQAFTTETFRIDKKIRPCKLGLQIPVSRGYCKIQKERRVLSWPRYKETVYSLGQSSIRKEAIAEAT